MKRLENGADVESAQSEVCWARIQFNVTRKKEKGEEKRTTETECALANTEQKDCRLGRNVVGVLSQAVRCREGWTWQEGEENRCKDDITAQMIRERYKRYTSDIFMV